MNRALLVQALYNEPSILNEKGYSIIGFEDKGIFTIRSRKDNRVLRIPFDNINLPNEPVEALNSFVKEVDKYFTKLDKTIKELKGE